jgi:hypothetical protein
MRRASNDYKLIIIDGVFVGVCLGYDYTAEHEHGYDQIKNSF